jgi:PTS system mannose-specific IIA component
MKQLILISHGQFCEELKNSVEMIMGPQENISTVALLPEEGKEDFTEKFNQAIEGKENVVVFADLFGGTPCNAAGALLMQGAKFDLYAGANMPMVIAFINGEFMNEDRDSVADGKEGIVNVGKMFVR